MEQAVKWVEPNINTLRAAMGRTCPQFADLPVVPIHSGGTDNAMFRLGDDMVLRIPNDRCGAQKLRKETIILTQLDAGPLTIPKIITTGAWADEPIGWAIFRWMPGQDYFSAPPNDMRHTAHMLARFILAMRSSPANHTFVCGAQNNNRGVPLEDINDVVCRSIEIIKDAYDQKVLMDIWQQSLAAKPHKDGPIWLHGDLHAGNLITHKGELTGVIDFGLAGMGDPAADLPAAWWLFDHEARQHFKHALNVDENEWQRGRGWALHNAVVAYSYYRDKDKMQLNSMARRALAHLLKEAI